MAPRPPTPIPFPLQTFPGQNPQESMGRLINAYVEELGDDRQKSFKTIRSAGLSQQAATTKSGYRGGLTVKNVAFEVWEDDAATVDASGTVTDIGAFPGTRPISIEPANPCRRHCNSKSIPCESPSRSRKPISPTGRRRKTRARKNSRRNSRTIATCKPRTPTLKTRTAAPVPD